MSQPAYPLCIGNFALDQIVRPHGYEVTPGGAALRVSLAWALFGQPIRLITAIGNEPIWEAVLALLQQNHVDTTEVVRAAHSLQFCTTFDADGAIVDFQAAHEEVTTLILDRATTPRLAQVPLVHICPFAWDVQIALAQRAAQAGATVSSMIHFSSLTATDHAMYRSRLPLFDLLFLNEAEAQTLVGHAADWKQCGQQLSSLVRRYVFLTCAERGAAVFAGGDLIATVPAAHLTVRDILGAGDCFAGGALAGLALTDDPQVALRYGAITAAFALADIGHQALARFLTLECQL